MEDEMDIRDKGIQTQLRTIGEITGRAWEELKETVLGWGDRPHTELRNLAQQTWGLSLMYAETVVLCAKQKDGDPLEVALGWYQGPKAVFLPIHEKLVAEVLPWGGVEAVPKKGYLSLRRSKQFATWGPVTNTRFEVGLNGKHLEGSARLMVLPPGQICHFKVVVNDVAEVDDEVVGWIKSAYEKA